MRPSLIALIALPLAACGGQESAEDGALPPRAAVVEPETSYVQALRTMPDGQRDATLLRAIRDAGRDCQQVTSSQEITAINGAPSWTATCQNDVTWVIILGNDGVAQVTNEAELRAAGIEM